MFLDEPTAGMDPHAGADDVAARRDLRDHGVTVVLTTHYMDEAEQLCDRVAIVDHGRLVAWARRPTSPASGYADETASPPCPAPGGRSRKRSGSPRTR